MRYVFAFVLIVPASAYADPDSDACAALALAKAARERTPAPAAKPVKVTNGFNCGAGFCGANGGSGCPSCPNGNGVCACGPKAVQSAPADPVIRYTLPTSSSSCPNGNCPQAVTGYYRRGLFR